MPIQKGSATFARYRVEQEKPPKPAALTKALAAHAFQPLDRKSEDERTSGFVELADKNAVEFTPGSLFEGAYAVFAYRIDEVRIPSAAVKAELETWQQKFEEENARKPGKKEKNDAKEEIKHTLKSRYPLASKTFEVSWNVEGGHAQLWAGSRKAIDELQEAFEEAFDARLIPVAPITVAPELKIPEKALTPTPSLSMVEEQ